MNKQELFVLPFPSTAVVRGPVLCTDGADLLLSMDFDDDGQKRSASLRFVRQRAFRKRSEIYCTGWHVNNTYDTICEVQGSDWVAELRDEAVPEWRDRWVMRHFMIYVDSFGCLEVIAESVALDGESAKNSGGT
jgi:hypothetical protein